MGNLADSVSTAVTSVTSIGLTVASGGMSGISGSEKDTSKPTSETTEGGVRSSGTGDDVDDIVARSESYKMDVQDFIDAVDIDDVLIQVSTCIQIVLVSCSTRWSISTTRLMRSVTTSGHPTEAQDSPNKDDERHTREYIE